MEIKKENSPGPMSYDNVPKTKIIGNGVIPKGKYERINFT